MIRLIVRTDEASMAANVGGSVNVIYKTFDIRNPELEAYLESQAGTYSHASIGFEIVKDAA